MHPLEWLQLQGKPNKAKIPTTDKDVEQQKFSVIKGRNRKWCGHFGK